MLEFFSGIRLRIALSWLLLSLTLGIFTGITQLTYHSQDFQSSFAFASDTPFRIEYKGEVLPLHENSQIINASLQTPFTQTLEERVIDFKESPPRLLFDENPTRVRILRFRKIAGDPYILSLFVYYSNLSTKTRSRLGYFDPNPFQTNYQIISDEILDQDQLSSSIELTASLVGEKGNRNYNLSAFVLAGLGYLLIHSILFSLALLPMFFLKRSQAEKLRAFLLKQPLLLLLLGLLAFLWGSYTLNLSLQAGIFRESWLLGISAFLPSALLGFVFYGTLITLVWKIASKLPLPFRFLILIGIMTLYLILFVQTGFLIYTSDLILHEYFAMITRDTIFFAFNGPTIIAIVILLGFSFYLLLKNKANPSFPWYFLLFAPLLSLLSYSFSLSTALNLQQRNFPLYSETHPAARLAFNPFLQAPLSFNREFVRYSLKLLHPAIDQNLNFGILTEKNIQSSQKWSLNLDTDPSRAPAGQRPFKRVILLTIEGYRLAYIPQFNPALKGLVKDYPFFGREEVMSARVPQYYASATFTTRSLLTLLNSHMNAMQIRYSLGNLKEYPSLPRLFKNAGFQTLFIQTAQKDFDNFGELSQEMGMDILQMEEFQFVNKEDYEKVDLAQPRSWSYPSRLLFQEVLGRLKEAKKAKESSFTLIINTDTHSPPIGMIMADPTQYGKILYEDAGVSSMSAKSVFKTLTSTYRFAYDLDLFYQELLDSELWDEDTLLIITADHSQLSLDNKLFPVNDRANRLDELPLFILSGRPLPPTTEGIYASHIDLAPTILDLMGWEKPAGYWGRSLYSRQEKENRKAWFALNDRSLYTLNKEGVQEHSLSQNGDLKSLWDTFFLAEEEEISQP